MPLRALRRWLYSVADDFFAKQLPHNVTWALTVLYALDAPGDLSSMAVQVGHPLVLVGVQRWVHNWHGVCPTSMLVDHSSVPLWSYSTLPAPLILCV